jgi:hypothetical protein
MVKQTKKSSRIAAKAPKKTATKTKKISAKSAKPKSDSRAAARTAKPKAKPIAKQSPRKTAGAKKTGAGERAGAFPEILKGFEEIINSGHGGEIDLEVYQSFNEQYKPSHWTRNPKTDDELWSFASDGTGGQLAVWQHIPGLPVEERPVVFLGSEGEVSPLASDLASFFNLIAHGKDPYQVATDTHSDTQPANPEMLEWVAEQWPNRKFPAPKKIIADAKSKYKHFEKHIRSQSATN